MEVTGKVKLIQQEVEKGNFKSRNIVVTTEEQYPQDISVQFVQDKCDLLDKFKVGENVVIGINLRGREWINPQGEAVYFNTIQGWKISKSGESTPSQPQTSSSQSFSPQTDLNEEEDGLPF